jgi:hypothetical protein
MPLLQCHNCHRIILPKSDGSCPACSKNTNDLSNLDPNVELLRIDEDDVAPYLCCSCGFPESRTIRITSRSDQPAENSDGSIDEDDVPFLVRFIFSWVLVFLGKLLVKSLSKLNEGKPSVTISVRQCRDCTKHHPIRPVQVDYDNCFIEILVRAEYAAESRSGERNQGTRQN